MDFFSPSQKHSLAVEQKFHRRNVAREITYKGFSVHKVSPTQNLIEE